MAYTGRHPGFVCGCGLTIVVAAALSPAGLRGQPISAWAWAVWIAAFVISLWMYRQADIVAAEAFRRMAWLVPLVLVFALPAALLAPGPSSRWAVALALATRALAAAAAGASLAAWLGPIGLVRAARQLGIPDRLANIFEATLSSLSNVLRQVRSMLRAREARRTGFGAWSDVVAAPIDTIRGFGRLVGALLLRSLERAEALERARRARGVGL